MERKSGEGKYEKGKKKKKFHRVVDMREENKMMLKEAFFVDLRFCYQPILGKREKVVGGC